MSEVEYISKSKGPVCAVVKLQLKLMTGREQFYVASLDRKFKTTGERLVGFP